MRINYAQFDYSTFNIEWMRKRMKAYQKPPTYHVSDHMGCGCFLDPPGYPTHFLRSVYTQYGNTPARGVEEVVDYRGELFVTRRVEDWEKIPKTVEPGKGWDWIQERHTRLMNRIWIPLPFDHERVRLWRIHVYCYFRNCYSVDGVDRNVNHGLLPDGPPEHHLGYLLVKKHYPLAEPEVHLSALGGYGSNDLGIGDWIDKEAVRPAPENCHPDIGKHPTGTTWCQHCGWRAA